VSGARLRRTRNWSPGHIQNVSSVIYFCASVKSGIASSSFMMRGTLKSRGPEDEAQLPGVEAVYSSSEESDGQASDHEPNDGVYTSSSSDSDEADRNQVIVCPSFDDEYDEFQE